MTDRAFRNTVVWAYFASTVLSLLTDRESLALLVFGIVLLPALIAVNSSNGRANQ